MNNDELRIDHGEGVYPPDDFTGLWEVCWPNENPKFRGVFRNGEPDGISTCWWENGQISQTGRSEAGECKGVWSDFDEDGEKFKETEYIDSKNFSVRWYEDGEVRETECWVDGIEQTK